MIRILMAATLALALHGAPKAQTTEDEAGVRTVIKSQLDAFQSDDWDRAFGYASPTIQNMFGTADRFGQMVRGGYPMVWRPGAVSFSGLEPYEGGGLRQVVVFTDQSGRAYVADYFMRQINGEWRINGVTSGRTKAWAPRGAAPAHPLTA